MSQSGLLRDRVIALSALMQSVTLVQQIADTGQVDAQDFETLLKSLLNKDAPSAKAVYGSVGQLKTGLDQFNQQLSKRKDPKDVILLRYAIGLLHLEKKLAKRPAMLDIISQEVDKIPQQIDYFGSISSPQVVARFANIYERTVSELTPRIQVMGNQSFLQQADNVNRVRALLLAGVRAIILWRQKGGRRWQFILSSNKLLEQSKQLYNEI